MGLAMGKNGTKQYKMHTVFKNYITLKAQMVPGQLDKYDTYFNK
jgi:hypothetical protein